VFILHSVAVMAVRYYYTNMKLECTKVEIKVA